MSSWQDGLRAAISAERPCGEDLEDAPELAAFDGYSLFGQSMPLDTPPDPRDALGQHKKAKPPASPEWREIRERALDTLARSKDLRVLTYLGTALLRTDGLSAFCDALQIASVWLDSYWDDVYPRVDGDGLRRRNTLNCFGDQMAVVDAVRRTTIVSSRQHGHFCLRDIEVAAGLAPPRAGEVKPEAARIAAAFGEVSAEELAVLQQGVTGAMTSLENIDARMREGVGLDAAPSFEDLAGQLARLHHALRQQLAARNGGVATEAGPAQTAGAAGVPAPRAVGAIASRQDAIGALDAVAAFFREHEPSSPVPLFVERAKRLVSKGFLEVMADVAPDGLAQARVAGGIKKDD